MTEHPPIRLADIIDNRSTAQREDGTGPAWGNFKNSIKEVGVIQPIILRLVGSFEEDQDASRVELVAGGRRRKACMELGLELCYHGNSCIPDFPGYLWVTDLSEADLKRIEFDENVQRRNIPWQTEVCQLVDVHEAKMREAGASLGSMKWGMRQTGVLMNVSLGEVSNTMKIVELLRAGDKEIELATSASDAWRIILQRKVDAANKILVSRGLASGLTGTALPVPSNITTDKPKQRKLTDITVLFDESDGEPDSSGVVHTMNETPAVAPGVDNDGKTDTIIPLSKMLFKGDMREVGPREFKDESMDFGLIDMPYGIDMTNFDLRKQDRVDKEHDVEANAELMPLLLQEYFRILRPQSWLAAFYDQDYHERLQKWGKDAGFSVQRWPIVWCKTHPCKNQASQYNVTKATETAMLFRKGNTTLNGPASNRTRNWFPFDGKAEAQMYDNPFAKPFDMWKVLIDWIALPGMKGLDLTCGEGSSLRAMIMCGMMPHGVEISELHYNGCVETLKKAYMTLTNNKVKFV